MVAKFLNFADKRLLKLFDRFWSISSQKVKPSTTQTSSTTRGPTQPLVPDAKKVSFQSSVMRERPPGIRFLLSLFPFQLISRFFPHFFFCFPLLGIIFLIPVQETIN